MDPQRKVAAGPVAPSSLKSARKSFAVTNAFVRREDKKGEILTVHTSTPNVEHRSFHADQCQLYQGDVNLLSIINTNKDIMCCKYTEDVNDIALGFSDGTVRLFDCNNGNCSHTLVDDECRTYPGPVTGIKHRPVSKSHPVTNTLLTSYVNGYVKCWKYNYHQCLYTIREKRQTLGLCYHPRHSKFVTYGDDAILNMYDDETQTQERAFHSSGKRGTIDGHQSRIFACTFNPRSNHELVSGGWDDVVICWDARQPFATRYFVGVHMCGEGLDFDKPGKQILTCSWQDNDTIQIWDYGSCKLIDTIVPDGHPSKLYCGKFVPNTNLIVCGGSDGNMLRVVDYNLKLTECSIRYNPGAIYAFDYGTVRRKIKKVPDTYKRVNELHTVPRVAFVSGKKLQIVDFG
ncbi:WD repeat-containing protein tag-125 [Papilio machaon]|uniref:WD repeat-containing protein tag-125 n=1 Tax=Papilio machaon TaxID=76193 RepID=A0A194QKL5_PAPMA|nr:transcription initiation factor TFIID subunit 5 [Papilio machaon]KPJ06103.1 WD repeat-containing protein tag-125 [Papilio machaon]